LLIGGIVDRCVEVVYEIRRVRIGRDGGGSDHVLVGLVPDLLEADDVGVGGRDGFRDVRAAIRLEWDEGASQGDVEGVDGDLLALGGLSASAAAIASAAFAATGRQDENTENN